MQHRILIAIFVLAFPLVAYIASLPSARFRNDITQWGDPASQAYQDFTDYRKKFGVNEFVVVSWLGCDLNDSRIEDVTEKIETRLDGLVHQISSGQRVYNQLRTRADLSDKAALKRIRKSFIAESSLATAIGFNLTAAGRERRSHVISQLEQILESSGVDLKETAFAGLGHNLHSLDREGLVSPFRMVPLILLLAFALTFFFVRNLWLALFINALGTFTGCLAFNFVYLANVDMNAIIWPLPTLTMLLAVSASLHFLSYFRKATESVPSLVESQKSRSVDERIKQRWEIAISARRAARKPILYCTLTTVVGLFSLYGSTSEPVRQFGAFGALSVVAANLLVLILLPSFLTLVGYAEKCQLRSTARKQQTSNQQDVWHWLAKFTRKFRWAIIACCVIVLVWCAMGVSRIQTGSDLNNFFPQGHRVLKDAAIIENSTPLNSVELLLHFMQHDEKNDRQRIRGIRALCSRIVKETPFESCVSAATFTPVFKKTSGALAAASEKVRMDRFKKLMLENSLLDMQPAQQTETWRISCRYSANNELDITTSSDQLKQIVAELFYKDQQLVFRGEQLETVTTGEFVLFDNVDQQFFHELMATYAIAFCIISLIIAVVLRKLHACILAVVPNVFPAVVVLGLAGHLEYSLDIASLMTASVALGIAVDDTLHFLLWRKKSTGDANEVIESTMRYCGRAMLQTSVILGGSIFLYAFCGFLPTVRFGVLLCGMMFAALVGDLLLLPALLAKPNRSVAS